MLWGFWGVGGLILLLWKIFQGKMPMLWKIFPALDAVAAVWQAASSFVSLIWAAALLVATLCATLVTIRPALRKMSLKWLS
jgi:hypothetical protein